MDQNWTEADRILQKAIGQKWNRRTFLELEREYFAGFTGTVSEEIKVSFELCSHT